MPTVEGLTPQIIWTMLYGLVAIALLFLIGYKVYDAIHVVRERKKKQRESEKPDFAEEVSQKVIDKLEPRFAEIERNLNRDKKRIETHEALITDIVEGNKEIHDGLSAIAEFMLVIGTYGGIGNNEHVTEANVKLQKFLATKL